MKDEYAINEDGVTVYDKATGEAVCTCGPETTPTFNKDPAVRQAWATVILRFLNEKQGWAVMIPIFF